MTDDADGMCPNCQTPWKCNGPHETLSIDWNSPATKDVFDSIMTQTEKRADRIRFAIDRFRKDLRLDGWDIRYDPAWDKKKHGRDATAVVDIAETYRLASVHLDPEVVGDNIEYNVAHELMHLVIHDMQQMLGQTAAKAGTGGQAMIDLMDTEVERICNAVAHALSGVLYEPVGKRCRKVYAQWCE